MRRTVVVMGVAGSGKSTVGAALDARLGVPFVDGDDLHPAANVSKMTRGTPLDDDDRAGWLDALAARIRSAAATGGLVLAASALRRAFRERLRAAGPVTFVFLHADRALLLARLAARRDHFFPAALLDSQLAALEPPGRSPDDPAVGVDAGRPLAETVASVAAALDGRGG